MGLKEKGRGGIYGGGGKKGELGGDKPRRDKDGGANRRGVNIARARRDENKSTVREQRATENQQPSKNEREKKKRNVSVPLSQFHQTDRPGRTHKTASRVDVRVDSAVLRRERRINWRRRHLLLRTFDFRVVWLLVYDLIYDCRGRRRRDNTYPSL